MRRRFSVLASALTAIAVLAASAGPANAIYRGYEVAEEPLVVERTIYRSNDNAPVDENGKKSCKTWAGGGYYWSPHGTVVTVTVTDDNGRKYTEKLKCEDGSWNTVVEFANPSASGYTFEADYAYVDASGTLRASTAGGSLWAAP